MLLFLFGGALFVILLTLSTIGDLANKEINIANMGVIVWVLAAMYLLGRGL